MINLDMQEIVEKLKTFFEGKKEIPMAFLFGSAAAGREIPESDVDVAVWYGKEYSLQDTERLWREIETLLHRNVDLIILNQARPAIAWAAMRGKTLIIRNYRLYLRKLLDFSLEAEDFRNFIFELWTLRRKLRGEFA